ncbi:helix-hairpin-helix domain-containing protein [Gudongella sp. DL1XJH-153]|uniref:helix-hairpin-helix domain-containing protein n=1 Tax=Gudongella sp. DL1XJH-153 TaxID=3409804 RepID=UPI003BB69C8B
MEFFTKKEQIAILSVVVLILGIIGGKVLFKEKEPETSDIGIVQDKSILEVSDQAEELKPALIMVHVSGQVYHPGIYELILGDRVVDVVDLAGGLTKQADLDRINLAKKLNDEDKIYIPSVDEILTVEADIIQSSSGSGLLNINSCSQQELESLPGIGEVIANRVVEYRNTSRFQKPEDIMNVSGIGDSKYEQIKDLITVK